MRIALPCVRFRSAGRATFWLLAGLAALAATGAGCSKPQEGPPSVAEPPVVQVTQPKNRPITRTVGQPSFVESYERTSIFPKLTGFIEKWNADIGDKVKKDQVLATLFVPELVDDLQTKKETVLLDKQRVELAIKMVKVAEADVKSAEARLTETQAILGQYEAQVARWDSQVKRLTEEVRKGTIDPQVLSETENQWKASLATLAAGRASIQKAEAELGSKKAALDQSTVAVDVARASLKVSDSDAKRMGSWVDYIKLTAPYDGIVVARNVNTHDFVMPSMGDPSASKNSPHLSPNGQAAPLYVVERTDKVRVFVDIPESDANYIGIGTKAEVLIRGYVDKGIPCTVTRTSWSLNPKSRTLRAEIDLDNPNSQILPGMYAFAKVLIERPNALSIPESALTRVGDKTFVWKYENGHSARYEIQTGISNGDFVEVTNRQPVTRTSSGDQWEPFTTADQVILGDLGILAEGGPVQLAKSAGK